MRGNVCATINGIVNSALYQSVPHASQTLRQIDHVLHFRLVDSLLHQAPDFAVSWIEVAVVWQPQILRDESRSLAFKKPGRLTSPVLKYKELARDVTYVLQYNVAAENVTVVGSIHLDSTLDEYHTGAAQFSHTSHHHRSPNTNPNPNCSSMLICGVQADRIGTAECVSVGSWARAAYF